MEPIKQEIINNIFENGDKLITGPILQTVLIDMIDDVNVKDQEILSKTGSWDDAVTQIPNLATKAELTEAKDNLQANITNLSESVARDLENVDLTGYATEQWVQNQGYLKEHQDISNLATKTELTEAKDNLQGNITNLSSSISNDIQNKGEEVKTWVQDQGYLKEHQDISGLATKTELTEAENNLQGNITSLSESVARDLASVPEGVATEQWVQNQDYASKTYVNEAVSSSSVDLTGYATETWVESQGYLKEHQDISNLATKGELNSVSQSIQADISNLATKGELNDTKNTLQGNITSLSESVARDLENVNVDLTGYATETWVQSQGYLKEHQDISGLATKAELTSVSESVQTDITNLSESVANSAVWKKGTGTDSIVQILTGADEANTPTATGTGSIATGYATTASEYYSHAEGCFTTALGPFSHAEGRETKALGRSSHAEGYHTTASNDYEHAQGQYNHNSENQIFSIGAGEYVNGSLTRRNAVSVLAVPNETTWINTASVFIQNIGGYDGTNPTPGTNDLATVINGMSTGGSSETLWKKGEGQDSIVQVLSGDLESSISTATGMGAVAIGAGNTASGSFSHAEGAYAKASESFSHAEGYFTKASGVGSHAEGQYTTASGSYSHAEGYRTTATGQYSHAEGQDTNASGDHSHAEGFFTIASNQYEHAQGVLNHSSESQIFSVGAGESIKDPNTQVTTETRRNAISVLSVPNSETQINTASFFVQNIGGYDGTNPLPGTNDLATVISSLSSGGGSSETLWKKGTGTDSIVQVLTGNSEASTPTASGTGAVATGQDTKASGEGSHAEGNLTHASGVGSHAEGAGTRASGSYSHAEGGYTVASNLCEHAQGRYNHNSENQIFSIGTGNSVSDRRNAVSVLEVSNNGSFTSSFFVQNIGGYDGTNPTPGTNDLATVINGLSSSGGSSETLWKKGEGQDSLVQKLTGNYEANTSVASGVGAIATGMFTTASGPNSHAEGSNTNASGDQSHAEGYWTNASKYASHAEGSFTNASGQYSHAEGEQTNASGDGSHAEGSNTLASGSHSHAEGSSTKAEGESSHAEGNWTIASNDYEHAQGRYNHNSENQIFSIGTGNSTDDRRNVVSVLEVSNNNSYTGSVFVQNVGGYDGTNPTPGTNDLATVINNLPSGGGSSETLWKKGTGTDSMVQAIADGTNLPTATANRAVATGLETEASGEASHAEGQGAIASGQASHAEGLYTRAIGAWSHTKGWGTTASEQFSHAEGVHTGASGKASHAEGSESLASGQASHAEGYCTTASNNYEHAQGQYNHSSTNQIFSVGAGEKIGETVTRRNAVSILEVPNSDTQVVTASFFVQNIGGYDGTNPTPGTNDLATVINGMAIEGGIGTSSETWTFTLEDGSTVTKNIVMR